MNEHQDEFSYRRSICDYEMMETMYRESQEQVGELKLIIATARNMELVLMREFLSKVNLGDDDASTD